MTFQSFNIKNEIAFIIAGITPYGGGSDPDGQEGKEPFDSSK
jgi:hypothetical protein